MKNLIVKSLRLFGYALNKIENGPVFPPDIVEPEFRDLFEACKPYTMTSVERLYALYQSVYYVIRNQVPGDFVECGVWKGGSAMLIAGILQQSGVKDRKIYLYDTYEGMSDPSEADADFKGKSASALLNTASKEDQASVWCYAPYEEVFNNMVKTGIDPENIVMVKGKVEETIPAAMPESAIALLRLDTDWYESTLHELNHLFPRLSPGGVLIVDDYGHWQGCRKAVDEYFEKNNINFLLNRIDYTGRVGIKAHNA